ncbi:SDR family NAD(P)-dependent oxidoreductase [Alteromonas lipolytica]|uniref:Oxidoreductase n=1 Tax=Alteromonas lipolytica TaxID=1856405 RepID=A0A1E8FGD0_9ALTE|nr:SDR family oxidoreductase [Alteromonas lipolytica]OFI34648.1 oxidoreductase [Alteromonas lipolytica]GGF52883.1 short-chain dehydrogenase [Alteromonas lipolytica]
MQIKLTGKTALVTGSTEGIGLGAAKQLAECGARVIVNGRTQQKVDKAIEAVIAAVPNAEVTGVAADLSTSEGGQALFEAVPEADILVNNLGIYGALDFFETDDETWQQYFDVNVMSAVRMSRHYAPAMVDNGWGRIVFIASESSVNIPSEMIHYGVSKTALLGLSRGLAKRLAGTGVTVNAVLPGPTMSEGVQNIMAESAARNGISVEEAGVRFVQKHRPSSVIQRMATVDEVASMITYTCSELASATTGSALRVDGGVVDFVM